MRPQPSRATRWQSRLAPELAIALKWPARPLKTRMAVVAAASGFAVRTQPWRTLPFPYCRYLAPHPFHRNIGFLYGPSFPVTFPQFFTRPLAPDSTAPYRLRIRRGTGAGHCRHERNPRPMTQQARICARGHCRHRSGDAVDVAHVLARKPIDTRLRSKPWKPQPRN